VRSEEIFLSSFKNWWGTWLNTHSDSSNATVVSIFFRCYSIYLKCGVAWAPSIYSTSFTSSVISGVDNSTEWFGGQYIDDYHTSFTSRIYGGLWEAFVSKTLLERSESDADIHTLIVLTLLITSKRKHTMKKWRCRHKMGGEKKLRKDQRFTPNIRHGLKLRKSLEVIVQTVILRGKDNCLKKIHIPRLEGWRIIVQKRSFS